MPTFTADPRPVTVRPLALLSGRLPIERRRLRAGERLFHEGDPGDAAQLVLSGLVGIEVGCGHREPVMADLFRPGDVAAAGRILRPGSRHEAGARALIATEVQLVRRCDLVAAGVLDEVIAVLAADGSDRSAGLLCRLAEIAHLPAGARVARALLRLAGGADVVTVNQDVVASCAGVTRVTANAELSTLAADGVVEVARCKVHILDRSMLERRSS